MFRTSSDLEMRISTLNTWLKNFHKLNRRVQRHRNVAYFWCKVFGDDITYPGPTKNERNEGRRNGEEIDKAETEN